MKYAIVGLLILAAAWSAVDAKAKARADIFPLHSTEASLGTSYVEFLEINDTHVLVTVSISGLFNNPDGLHGIHIHTYGDISDPAALGGHWNPDDAPHGCEENAVRHAGDMGNWQATGGSISATKELDLVKLHGAKSIIGRGIVVHNNTDDCVTVMSSGARLAGGVIGISNEANNEALASSNLGTGNFMAVCTLVPTTSYGVPAGLERSSFYWTQATGSADVYAAGYLSVVQTRGVHIHTFGDMTDRAVSSTTGSHFDPEATGFHDLPGHESAHHAGDMGNINDTNVIDGTMWYEYTFPSSVITIQDTSSEKNYSIIGRALVVHSSQDQGSVSQPAGGSGNREAHCVIGIADPTISKVTRFPTQAPSPVAAANALAFPAAALLFTLALSSLLLWF